MATRHALKARYGHAGRGAVHVMVTRHALKARYGHAAGMHSTYGQAFTDPFTGRVVQHTKRPGRAMQHAVLT
eukprot:3555203-Rhodomonas_salina.1